MSDHVQWSNEPPSVPIARIWSPPNGTCFAIVLAPWHGCWVHWMGKRTLPCFGDNCPKVRCQKPAHWFAYLPVAIPQDEDFHTKGVLYSKSAVIAVGRENANYLKPFLKDFPGPILEIHRRSNSREWKIAKVVPLKANAGLPDPFDVRPTLWRIWGMRPEEESDQAGD